MLFRKIIGVYCENYTRVVWTLCRLNAEFLDVTSGGIYNYHWTLNGLAVWEMKLLGTPALSVMCSLYALSVSVRRHTKCGNLRWKAVMHYRQWCLDKTGYLARHPHSGRRLNPSGCTYQVSRLDRVLGAAPHTKNKMICFRCQSW